MLRKVFKKSVCSSNRGWCLSKMALLEELDVLVVPLIGFLSAVLYLALFVLLYKNRFVLFALFRLPGMVAWFFLLFVFAVALLLRFLVFPLENRVMFDEHIYMAGGRAIALTGSFNDVVLKSSGWPFLLGVLFRIFDVNNWVALRATAFLGAVTVFPVFFLGFLMTKSRAVGFVAAGILAFFPLHVLWSTRAETNVPSLFFVTLAMAFSFLYYKHKTHSTLWLALAALAIATTFRPENFVYVLLFCVGVLAYCRDSLRPVRFRFVVPFIVLGFLALPSFVHVLHFQTAYNWMEADSGGKITGDNWSFSNLVEHSQVYGVKLFQDYFPVLLFVLVLVGFAYMWYRQPKNVMFLYAWFVLLWVAYFSSWWQTLGYGTRLYTSFYPIIAVFAAYGVLAVYELMRKRSSEMISKAIAVLLVAVLFFSLSQELLRLDDDTFGLPRLETAFQELAEQDVPESCVIVAGKPLMLSTVKNKIVHVRDFVNPKVQSEVFAEHDCVLLLDDRFCSSAFYDAEVHKQCGSIKSRFLLEEFKTYTVPAEERIYDEEYTTYEYVLYGVSNESLKHVE